MRKLPSVMPASERFATVPRAEIQRSSFDRSHGYKTTFNAGDLVPFYVDEALPGDTFSLRVNAFARLATPVKPLMDNLYLDTFFFAVPYRLVWTNFVKMMGEQANPGDSTSYVVPITTAPAGGYSVGTIEDYMGLPTGVAGFSHSALWMRAIKLIWNEWFRDQNLQNSLAISLGDGPDAPSGNGLAPLVRGKRHDYFTGALPFTQKGTAVGIGGFAPVMGIAVGSAIDPANGSPASAYETGGVAASGWAGYLGDSSGAIYFRTANAAPSTGGPLIQVDLSGVTVNALRQSFQIQKMLERDARGGTRYTELVRAQFNVVSPDARLQRPEYLGGGTTPVIISPIAQNSSTDATTPQGNLSGIGTANMNSGGFVKSFTEHTLLVGFVCARADLTYQQGLNKMWSRSTRYDFFWPALAHLGEQAVLNREIFTQGTAGGSADASVFGYQERYAEYRYKPSLVTGEFRSTYGASLDVWHLSEEFASLPTLGATFIQARPPMDRVKAVVNEPDFLLDCYFRLHCARPMPVYGVPGLIDHF